MEDFQIALNSIQTSLERVPTSSCTDPTFKATHLALMQMLSTPCAETLCGLIEHARDRMENVVCCDLPRDGAGLLQTMHQHITSLTLQCGEHQTDLRDVEEDEEQEIWPRKKRRHPGSLVVEEEVDERTKKRTHQNMLKGDTTGQQANRDSQQPSLVHSEADTVVGVAWGLLSAMPVLTFSPNIQRWLSWSTIEFCGRTMTSPSQINHTCFRPVTAAELSNSVAMGTTLVEPDDDRSFFAISFVAAQIRRDVIVHELVIAVGSAFCVVVARDTSSEAAPMYMFPAITRTSQRGTLCKLKDVVAQAQTGGYLAFVSYLVLRAIRTDLPDFSFVAFHESKERDVILRAAASHVLAASRLWPTERILQTLRREVSLDVKEERFSHELCSFSEADRVFTGGVYQGYGIRTSMELSKRISELERQSLRENVTLLLFALNSLVLDTKYKAMAVDYHERMMWPTLLHQLHMEGDKVAATSLFDHMKSNSF